jgi:hypothetical protein
VYVSGSPSASEATSGVMTEVSSSSVAAESGACGCVHVPRTCHRRLKEAPSMSAAHHVPSGPQAATPGSSAFGTSEAWIAAARRSRTSAVCAVYCGPVSPSGYGADVNRGHAKPRLVARCRLLRAAAHRSARRRRPASARRAQACSRSSTGTPRRRWHSACPSGAGSHRSRTAVRPRTTR